MKLGSSKEPVKRQVLSPKLEKFYEKPTSVLKRRKQLPSKENKNQRKNRLGRPPDFNSGLMASSIKSLIEENVKTSMKERNKEKTLTLRMAISEFKKEEIDKQVDLTNEDSIRIIQRMIKQRKESMSQFIDAGRKELAEKEEAEITILKEFLPEQLSEEITL